MESSSTFIGLGTGDMNNNVAYSSVKLALELGYRTIDTADSYKNEEGIGRALRESNVPRSEVRAPQQGPQPGQALVQRLQVP